MSESNNTEFEYIEMTIGKGTASRLEYDKVTIGKVRMPTTKAMADRFAAQIAKQPEYQQQFYNPLEFVQGKEPPNTENL